LRVVSSFPSGLSRFCGFTAHFSPLPFWLFRIASASVFLLHFRNALLFRGYLPRSQRFVALPPFFLPCISCLLLLLEHRFSISSPRPSPPPPCPQTVEFNRRSPLFLFGLFVFIGTIVSLLPFSFVFCCALLMVCDPGLFYSSALVPPTPLLPSVLALRFFRSLYPLSPPPLGLFRPSPENLVS